MGIPSGEIFLLISQNGIEFKNKNGIANNIIDAVSNSNRRTQVSDTNSVTHAVDYDARSSNASEVRKINNGSNMRKLSIQNVKNINTQLATPKK